MKNKNAWIVAVALIAVHAVLCLDAAKRLSPPWDEMANAAGGAAQWETGQILVHDTSFLSRLIYGAATLPLHPTIPFDHPSWTQKNWALFGHLFLFHNSVSSKKIIFWSRVPSVILSAAMATILFAWVLNIWGPGGALLVLVSYFSVPLFLSRASLALTEMPMFFFTLSAIVFYDRWRERHSILDVAFCSITSGLALLCKFAAFPLLLGMALNEILFSKKPMSQRIISLAGIYGGAIGIVAMGYALCADGGPALKRALEFPFVVDQSVTYFWKGTSWTHLSSLITLGAIIIKAPLFVLGLAVVGFWGAWRKSETTPFVRMILIFTGSFLLPVLFFKNPVSTIQIASFYLGIVVLTGGAWAWPARNLKTRVLFLTPFIVGMVVTVALAHPNYLAYFNPLVGGSSQGYKWLGDSDQDWGQSLPALAKYFFNKKEGNVFLCYAGPSEPAAYGLSYIDLFSPAIVSKEHHEPPPFNEAIPSYLAIGTKVLQIEPDVFSWIMKNRKPVLIDSCFFVFEVTRDPEVFEWMATIYDASNRTRMAEWATEQARRCRLEMPSIP